MFWRNHKFRNSDLDRELRSHLDLEAEEQQANGLSPDEAQYAAKRALGNPTLIKERVRETWRWIGFERISQDLRYALRILRRNPACTALAIVSRAIAIGANTAMFSILDAWLIRPLPFRDSNRIVTLLRSDPKQPTEAKFFPSYRDFLAWKAHSHSFEQIAGAYWRQFTFNSGDNPHEVGGMIVTANLFRMLGVKPVIGRTFLPSDRHGPSVAVIGYSFWQQYFAGKPDVLGKTIEFNGRPYEIIGIIPKNKGLRRRI